MARADNPGRTGGVFYAAVEERRHSASDEERQPERSRCEPDLVRCLEWNLSRGIHRKPVSEQLDGFDRGRFRHRRYRDQNRHDYRRSQPAVLSSGALALRCYTGDFGDVPEAGGHPSEQRPRRARWAAPIGALRSNDRVPGRVGGGPSKVFLAKLSPTDAQIYQAKTRRPSHRLSR